MPETLKKTRPKSKTGKFPNNIELDQIAIDVKSHKLLDQLLKENPKLEELMRNAKNETEVLVGMKHWVLEELKSSPEAVTFYNNERFKRSDFKKLKWRDYAAIRLLDYIDNAGREFPDLNLRGEIAISNPIKLIWLAVNRGTGGAKPYFFEDMLHLFRQFSGRDRPKKSSKADVEAWMDRYPSGLDPRIIKLREENRDRIINTIIKNIEKGKIVRTKYQLPSNMSYEQKFLRVLEWWQDPKFHLSFAVRSPDLLNEMLGHSLDPDTMKILYDAEKKGIPFFANPYYLSLLNVRVPYFAIGSDLAIRYYVLYSRQLVNEFGHIVAWELEDKVEPGKPNAAGWLLPTTHNIHRRYPDVAILIPDTMGRSCGGLCSSCQRMYNFQNGRLNFNLDKLKPTAKWSDKLKTLMAYFEKDSQLRDILITGGDALMSSDKSLQNILDAVYTMAKRKKEANKKRKNGEKYAEIVRVRLGTRLPAYLPQRITPKMAAILSDFRKKAKRIGVRQFIVQTHIESPMEVTPECETAIQRLINAGWVVTNQLVFTTGASRRGHTAKLRKVLSEIGILPYYTFTVKGYMETYYNFTPNARAVQEELEEKIIGRIPKKFYGKIKHLSEHAEDIYENIAILKKSAKLPFLSTDRNVLNLPGVGKSMTFRVIGITRYGRRILEFDHDRTRSHSPVIEKMGKMVIIESKSISEYLSQLSALGEDVSEYEGIYGYSLGATEHRLPLYEYPDFPFKITDEITNLEIK
jgi:lysine 2,3-aminomutase